MLLHKIGARVWIARILISWGIIATATGAVHTAQQLYVARFILGVAEAGFFPGIVLYLTYWFPRKEQARVYAVLLMATPVTSILGAPISGLILDHVQWLGLTSWRWLLILEGIPAVLLGGLTYFVLPGRPDEAKFLTAEEKRWIKAALESEEQQKLRDGEYSVMQVLASRRVWHLVLVYFGLMVGLHTLASWAPQLIRSFSKVSTNSGIGLLLILPSVAGLIAMSCVSYSSDRRLERRYHVALPAISTAIALCLLATALSSWWSIVLLCLWAAGVYSYLGPFWALPNEFLTGYSASAGIALINSVGNLGGLVGPTAVGFFAQRFGKITAGLAVVALPLLLSAALVLLLPKKQPARAQANTAR